MTHGFVVFFFRWSTREACVVHELAFTSQWSPNRRFSLPYIWCLSHVVFVVFSFCTAKERLMDSRLFIKWTVGVQTRSYSRKASPYPNVIPS